MSDDDDDWDSSPEYEDEDEDEEEDIQYEAEINVFDRVGLPGDMFWYKSNDNGRKNSYESTR